MTLAETAELAVRLTLDDRMSGAIKKAQGGLRNLGSAAKTVGKGIAVGVGVVGASAVVALGKGIHDGIESLRQLETATAQTNAVIKSTKQVAGISAQAIVDLSEKYESLNATIDNKVIQSGENVLLTFTNIRKNAFEPALEAALNLSTAMGQPLQTSIVQIGKALNDPIKGLTSLGRIGVKFTDAQKVQIAALYKLTPAEQKHYDTLTKGQQKAFMASHDLNASMAAQQIILKELGNEFGGSFAAGGKTAAGQQAALADAIEDVEVALATDLLPVVTKITQKLTEYLGKPSTLAFFKDLGQTISNLFTDENLDTIAGAMQTAAQAVSGALTAFNALPAPIKALAVGAFAINKLTGGAVTGVASLFGKIVGAGISKIFAANVTVIGTNVTGPGGGIPGGGAAVGGGAATGLAAFAIPAAVAAGGSQLGNSVTTSVTDFLTSTFAPDPRLRAELDKNLHIWIDNALPTPGSIQHKIEDVFNFVTGANNRPALAGGNERERGAVGLKEALKPVTAGLDKNITKLESLESKLHKAKESGDDRRIGNLRQRVDHTKTAVDSAKQSITSANVAVRDAAARAGVLTSGSVSQWGAAIVNAIRPPIVQVFVTSTNVETSIVQHARAGPSHGSSSAAPRRPGNGTGNGGGN